MQRIKDYIRSEPLRFLEETKAAILFTDKNRNILYANSSFQNIFKVTGKDIQGLRCWELMHPDDAECRGCPKGLFHNVQAQIEGQEHTLAVAGSSCGEDLVLRIINDVTGFALDVSVLRKEVQEMRENILGIIGFGNTILVCTECHRIRLDDGMWVSKQMYKGPARQTIRAICPECLVENTDNSPDKGDG